MDNIQRRIGKIERLILKFSQIANKNQQQDLLVLKSTLATLKQKYDQRKTVKVYLDYDN